MVKLMEKWKLKKKNYVYEKPLHRKKASEKKLWQKLKGNKP